LLLLHQLTLMSLYKTPPLPLKRLHLLYNTLLLLNLLLDLLLSWWL
jgi:hypothetical protein